MSERAVNNGKKIREAGKAEGKLIKQESKDGETEKKWTTESKSEKGGLLRGQSVKGR